MLTADRSRVEHSTRKEAGCHPILAQDRRGDGNPLPASDCYEVPAAVPVADAVESLLGAERILLDIGPLLERLVPNLQVQVRVYVREVSEGSFREVLLTALFLTYQKDLERE